MACAQPAPALEGPDRREGDPALRVHRASTAAQTRAWVNTAVWTNTLFVTDANGKPLGNPPLSFNMPASFPGFLGTTLHHSALLFDVALVGTFATEPVAVKLY